jgi:hydroxymethylglutaryl-CoA reductase
LAEQNIQVLTAIVSNNSTESLVTAEATIEIDDEIAYKIAQLSEIAQLDPYRAVTDNKGFLNGASGVVQATGNDYRAFEAGVHAYAVAFGQYQSVTKWTAAGGVLKGITTIPVMVGILGGTIGVHPVAQANLKLLDVQSGDELASVIAATGLAQNFAALYALVTTGIQSGHMKLHNKAVNKETND